MLKRIPLYSHVTSLTHGSEEKHIPEENKVYTIFDRPFGLRFIGLLEMSFGAVGLLSTVGAMDQLNLSTKRALVKL